MEKHQQEKLKEFLHISNALLESMNASVRTDTDNLWKYSGYWEYARKYNQLVEAISQIIRIDTVVDRFNMDILPSMGDTVLPQQRAYFESVHVSSLIKS